MPEAEMDEKLDYSKGKFRYCNMDTIELDLGPINGTVKVKLLRKKIKNVYLKVFRSLEVVLSVPEHISDEWIHSFLFSRQKWIDNQI